MLRFSRENPDFVIEKNGRPYMSRWWLTEKDEESYRSRNRPALLLHRIWQKDGDRFPHDHPWWFVSLVLKGNYVENRYDRNGIFCGQVKRRRFSLAFRHAADLHDVAEVSDDLWTLVLVGRKQREWGFMTNEGWVHWEIYTAANY